MPNATKISKTPNLSAPITTTTNLPTAMDYMLYNNGSKPLFNLNDGSNMMEARVVWTDPDGNSFTGVAQREMGTDTNLIKLAARRDATRQFREYYLEHPEHDKSKQ